MDSTATGFIFGNDIREVAPERRGAFGKEFYGNETIFIKSVDRDINSFHQDIEFSNGLLDGSALVSYIPEYSFAYGNNHNGEKRGFIVMRRIWGQDIEDIMALDFDSVLKLDHLLTLCIDFARVKKRFPDVIHTFQNDAGKQVSRLTNIRLGWTIPASHRNQIFLTDFMSMFDLQYIAFNDLMTDLYRAIREFEFRTGNSLTLTKSKLDRLIGARA